MRDKLGGCLGPVWLAGLGAGIDKEMGIGGCIQHVEQWVGVEAGRETI